MIGGISGLLLIFGGGILLISEILGFNLWRYATQMWPLIIIFYSVVKLLDKKSSKPWSLFWLVVGTVLQLQILNLLNGNVVKILFSAALISVGLNTLLNNRHKDSIHINRNQHTTESEDTFTRADYEEKMHYKARGFDIYNNDLINGRFIFSSDGRVYKSSTFSGGNLELYFSSLNLDLSKVIPLEEELTINCHVFFSTLNIQVPDNWHVIIDGKHYFPESGEGVYTLILNSKVTFGDLSVI